MEKFMFAFCLMWDILCYGLGAITAVALVALVALVAAMVLAKAFDVASDKIVDWRKRKNRAKQFSKKP